jgi:ubiquinone biosynthesis protein COQ9
MYMVRDSLAQHSLEVLSLPVIKSLSLAALGKLSSGNFFYLLDMASPIQSLRVRALPRAFRHRYHSYSHPQPAGPFNPIEAAILSAALSHVPSHGFTRTSVALGARDAGYLDASTNLFPKGAFSLVHYHLVAQRLKLANSQTLQSSDNGVSLGVGAKVKALTWERLMQNVGIIHKWQEVRLFSPCRSSLVI